MADKENCRLTRAAARKQAAFLAFASFDALIQPRTPLPAKRKRMPLAELSSFSNNSDSPPRRRAKRNFGNVTRRKRETQKAPLLEAGAAEAARSEPEDPQLCKHYAADIDAYLRSMEVEKKRRPLANYIEAVQKDISANMRAILVDWLVEVAEEYKLLPETLYLTISYLDRFLSSVAINRHKLQLLGVSCMLIAAKYEEINPPHVEDFCFITDNTYNKKQVVEMERDILKSLKFEMGNPIIKTFLERFVMAAQEIPNQSDCKLEFLCNYLAELSLLDYGCLQFLPSVIAASAVFVARFTIDPETRPWNATMESHTGYKVSELRDCIIAIHDRQLNRRGSTLRGIRDKYKQQRFQCVSSLLSPSEIPASYLQD